MDQLKEQLTAVIFKTELIVGIILIAHHSDNIS